MNFTKKTAQSKQSPNRRKIAQSGHPAPYPGVQPPTVTFVFQTAQISHLKIESFGGMIFEPENGSLKTVRSVK
jgi:hypothetical protein